MRGTRVVSTFTSFAMTPYDVNLFITFTMFGQQNFMILRLSNAIAGTPSRAEGEGDRGGSHVF